MAFSLAVVRWPWFVGRLPVEHMWLVAFLVDGVTVDR